MSVETDVRRTPRAVIDAVSDVFRIGLDAAATRDNAVVPSYLGPDHVNEWKRDGLQAPWSAIVRPGCVVWVNPPYSRGSIGQWCQKATEEARRGVTTVMLLPADTSTRYFHEFVLPNRHHFLRGRLRFEGAPLDRHGKLAPAKFGSVLVVFEPPRPWSR